MPAPMVAAPMVGVVGATIAGALAGPWIAAGVDAWIAALARGERRDAPARASSRGAFVARLRPRAPRHFVLIALNAALWGGLAARYGLGVDAVLWMLFASALLAAAAIDAVEQIIPDEISLGGLAAGLVLPPLLAPLSGVSVQGALSEAALGACLGALPLWLIGFAHARLCSGLGRRFAHWPGDDAPFPRPLSADYWLWFPGLGLGDVKLMGMIGAWLGAWGVLQSLLAACVIGLAVGLAGLARQRAFDARFGFGPALACGAIFTALFPGLWPPLQ